MGSFQVLTTSKCFTHSMSFNSFTVLGDSICDSHTGNGMAWGLGHTYVSLDLLGFWSGAGAWRTGWVSVSTILIWGVSFASLLLRSPWTPQARESHLSSSTSMYKTWRGYVQKRGEKLPKSLQEDHLSAPLLMTKTESHSNVPNSNTGNKTSVKKDKKD